MLGNAVTINRLSQRMDEIGAQYQTYLKEDISFHKRFRGMIFFLLTLL